MYTKLRALLNKEGITIEELSKAIGIHRNSIKNKLTGATAFTVPEILKIKNIYFPNLTIDEIISEVV